jgi:hypothetical protein
VDRASRKVGKEEMTTAGVGGGEERQWREGAELEEEEGRGLMAERRASRGVEEVDGTTRARPFSAMPWSA